MKKLLSIALTIVMLASFCGCGLKPAKQIADTVHAKAQPEDTVAVEPANGGKVNFDEIMSYVEKTITKDLKPQIGVKVLSFSCITDFCPNVENGGTTHAQVLENAEKTSHDFVKLVKAVVKKLA